MRGYVLAMLVLLVLIQAGCASRDMWPVERVDPDTAVHITVMAEPWIYALDDPMRAADARDYLNVAVVETNQMGTRAYWLNAVTWSTTVRTRPTDDRSTPPSTIRLAWSGNQLELAPAADGRSTAGLSEPAFSVPAERLKEAWYPLSAADLARLAARAPNVVSLVDEAGRVETYAVWRVNAEAMSGFLKATESGPN